MANRNISATIQIGATMSSSVGSVFGGITRKVNDLGSSLAKLKRQSSDIARLQAAQGRMAEAQAKGNTAAVARYSAQIEKLSASLREAGVDTSRLTSEQARLAAQIRNVESSLSRAQRWSVAWNGLKTSALGVGSAFGKVKDNVTSLATKLGVLGAAAGYLFKTQFVDTAAEFEKLQTMLTSVEGGDVGKAKASFSWITKFATETPLQLAEATSAFIKFKNYGLDPTHGGLAALEDQNAKMGGGIHELEGLIMAVGQAWTKQKLQGEEIMQLQERGVPVWDLLSKAMGKSVAELQKMSSAGKLGRKEIELLLKAIGENAKGAAKAQMKTWGGMISNLSDWWSRFTGMVMSEGLFNWMKGKLDGLLTTLEKMSNDGSLQKWAQDTGAAIKNLFDDLWELGKSIWNTTKATAELVGGWKNLGVIIGSLMLAPTILSVVQLTGALWKLGAAVTVALGPWGILAAAVIGAGAALIYYREEIGRWLIQQPIVQQGLVLVANTIKLLTDAWNAAGAGIEYFKGLFVGAISEIQAMWNSLVSSITGSEVWQFLFGGEGTVNPNGARGGIGRGSGAGVGTLSPVGGQRGPRGAGAGIMPANNMPAAAPQTNVRQNFQINVTAPSADPAAVGGAVRGAIQGAPLYDSSGTHGPK